MKLMRKRFMLLCSEMGVNSTFPSAGACKQDLQRYTLGRGYYNDDKE